MQCHECWSLMGLEREAFAENLRRELPAHQENWTANLSQFLQTQWQSYRLAIVVSALMITLNHGTALVRGQMTKQRWLSLALGFMVPLVVNRYQPRR
ncbi:hypothetical protein GlitD10_2441 [Gloeomargarita lithophora Alchichica-D10]|uniref:Uncharacterized protein n=1 Tax=Gloeomargarita lithophora Alchichica-D10 TaxID=1188229 RepID=A0A1J0AFR1_9CYAN|nr:nitrate/nitrite transporter NrtS [Gloeomargarita lithophora]APB34777.1 hypothetical protein GlitD10_2441 [Gloeomargarita lithophora Alchichica-D10]